MAEEEGFEPPRGLPPAGFQDQSLQPDLGIPPEGFLIINNWWTRQDSNLRPTGYEPGALTRLSYGSINGSGGGSRTHDLSGMNRML